MLSELHIKNLAVVEDASLRFRPGLNVLTGSTGAGKSLILGAVNFLLGERASSQVIRAGEGGALVEGVFILDSGSGDELALGGPLGEKITLRREVHRNGRSQAWLNGKACTVKQLQEVSRKLIEPHGQNEQLRLKFAESHIAYLDKFAGNQAAREIYEETLGVYNQASAVLREFDSKMKLLKEKKELFEHRIEEIDRAKIAPGEKESVEERLRILENANEVFETLAEAEQVIYEDESSAVSLVSRIRGKVERFTGLDKRFEGFADELEKAEITLKETVSEMRSFLDGLEFEPGELERNQERLAFLTELERRYQMEIDDVLEECEVWRSELESIVFEDETRKKLNAEKTKCLGELRKAAMSLTESRRKSAAVLDKNMTAELGGLMMAGACFRTDLRFEVDDASDLVIDKRRVRAHPHGLDQVEFYVQTNPGESEGPLAEIASSGELSRIALALKDVVTSGSAGHERAVLIFDEVDAGVGADLGETISRKLETLADSYQIICITHMPQIAARGDHHLVVSKQTDEGRTFTRVAETDGENRLGEIARMLGGSEGSEKRLDLAREMLQNRKSNSASEVRP